MHKFIFISFFAILFFTAAQAQKKYVYEDSTLSQAEELYDSTVVVKERVEENYTNKEQAGDTIYIDTSLYYSSPVVSPDTVAAWKNLKEFAYVKKLDSLLKAQQRKEKIKEKVEETGSSGPNFLSRLLSSGGLQIFLWALAILFVLFILYKLFLTDGVFRKTPKAAKLNPPEVEEEIINSESDFEILIRQAVQSGNYRLAVRYQYLQTLHKLANKNLIELAADKTNHQYVREIKNQNYQNGFAALTLNYEYVWYGEFAIEENIYKKMEQGFLQFNSMI